MLLPFHIFAEKPGVSRIVAETREGSFGLLPQRLDCVAALAPGILICESETDGEVFVAVDEAALVKTGPCVLVSVLRAIGGTDLGQLREAVENEFLTLDENEQSTLTVIELFAKVANEHDDGVLVVTYDFRTLENFDRIPYVEDGMIRNRTNHPNSKPTSVL